MVDEEKIDRRAHWIQVAIGAIIAVTVFCVTIKLTVAQLEQDFKDYKKEQKISFKDLDNRIDSVSDKANANSKDIEWIIRGRR